VVYFSTRMWYTFQLIYTLTVIIRMAFVNTILKLITHLLSQITVVLLCT